MIKKIQIWTIFIMIGLLFTACGDDNAYDGKTGLISGESKATKAAFVSIQKNVLIPNARAFLTSTQTLESTIDTIEGNVTSAQLQSLQGEFKTLIMSWKSVQTTFLAPTFNEDFEDHVFLIDQFHTGNVAMAGLIDRALAQSGDLNGLLYKTTTRGVPALEYLLFAEGIEESAMLVLMDARRVQATKIAVKNIQKKALEIVNFYESDSKFSADAKVASDAIINVLIKNNYELKEWRVGDPAGFTNKFKNRPDAKRLEYHRSHYSIDALKAILNTQTQVMSTQSYENFSGFATDNGASKESAEVQRLIASSQSIVNSFNTPLTEAVSSAKMLELYKSLQDLYNAYYVSLIAALDIKAKIVEADGD